MQAIAEDKASLRGLRMREGELLGMDGAQEMMDLEGEGGDTFSGCLPGQ